MTFRRKISGVIIKKQHAISFSPTHQLIIVLLSLIGVCTILYSTSQFGAGVSPDSVRYIGTARNLADGIGFISHDNKPLLVQPPLYPIFLAILDLLFGVDPAESANFVSAFFWGLSIYFTGLLFIRHLSPIYAIIGSTTILVSIPLVRAHFWAWSEPPFVFFLVLFLFSLTKYQDSKNKKYLILLTFSAALASLTRYIGLVLVLTGIAVLFMDRQKTQKLPLKHAFSYSLISFLPLCIWVGRNFIISGTLFGPRSPSLRSLTENVHASINTIMRWYLPAQIEYNPTAIVILVILLIFVLLLYYYRSRFSPIKLVNQIPQFDLILLVVVVGYVGLLVVSASMTQYDSIDDRLLSSIFIPLTLLLFRIIECLVTTAISLINAKIIEIIIVMGVAIWLIYPASSMVEAVIWQHREGSGFNSKLWRSSQTIEYLRWTKLPKCAIYSNGPDVIYHYLDMDVKSIPPRSDDTIIGNVPANLEYFFLENDRACLIWFNQLSWRSYLITPEEVLLVTNIEQSIPFDDGTIFMVSKK